MYIQMDVNMTMKMRTNIANDDPHPTEDDLSTSPRPAAAPAASMAI
jgi:hypothetical protein